MAILPRTKNITAYTDSIRERLSDRTGITHWAYDSTSRIISDIVGIELSMVAEEGKRAFKALQVSQAKGENLDALANMPYGVDRGRATYARVEAKHKSLSFYSQHGTFGDINNGSSIAIPAGTLISTEPVDGKKGTRVNYRTVSDIVCPSTESLIFVSAVADTVGSGQNVGERALSHHNFSTYADAARQSLKVTNRFSILNGQDEQDDERVRFRIARQFASIVQNNIDKVKLFGIQVPGLEDVRIVDGYYGIGTAACFCFGVDEESNEQLAQSLQDKLSTVHGPGFSLIAAPGVVVYIDIELRVQVAETLTALDETIRKRAIRRTLMNSIKSSSLGRVVNLSAAASSVLRNHRDVVSLVTNSHSVENFEAVYIRKMTSGSSDIAERRKVLTSSYVLEEEEAATLGTLEIIFERDITGI